MPGVLISPYLTIFALMVAIFVFKKGVKSLIDLPLTTQDRGDRL